jgi:hypothetical protein
MRRAAPRQFGRWAYYFGALDFKSTDLEIVIKFDYYD